MPNMVANRVFFGGYDKQMEFINKLKPKGSEEEFSFEWLIPTPKDCEDPTDWHWKNWGTKWDVCNLFVGIECLEFDTPWNEPEGIYRKMAEMFPDMDFTAYYLYDDESHMGYYDHVGGMKGLEDYEEDNYTDEWDQMLKDIWGLYGDEEDNYTE